MPNSEEPRYDVLTLARAITRTEELSPVGLHIDDKPSLRIRLIKRLVEMAETRVPVIGEFTLGVGVVHKPHEASATAAAVHCSISRSPSELPKAKIGRRPMKRLMSTGLPAHR